ncbi:MAG: protein kinase [Myxococcota bacterium]
MDASSPAESALPGQVIGGRFRIEAELGEGGMAHVYRVTDLATQKPFALKLLKPEVAADSEAVARLRREGEVLATLDSPAVVGIETFGKLPDGRLFLVMEYLEGETLGQKMRREQRIEIAELAPIVAGAAAGLAAAHRAGVIHRDLKPDNVFLEKRDDAPVQVRLLDFGISKVYDQEERLTRTGQILGTPRYMAPEQLAADDLDARVDTYAFGVILYEALAGSPPFIATSPSDLVVAIIHGKVTPLRTFRPDLDPDLEAVVVRAMSRNREARYETALSLAEAFLAAAGTAALPASRPSGTRLGMRTSLLGSGGASSVAEIAPSDPLRPGTFSAFEQSEEPAGETKADRPAVMTRPATPAVVAVPSAAPTSAAASAMAMSGPVELPTRSRTWLWVIAALIAGAATAAGILTVLEGTGEEEAVADEPPAEVEAPEPPPSEEPADVVSGLPPPAETEMAIPVGEIPAAEESPMTSRRRRDRRRSPRMEENTVPEPFVAETMVDDPLNAARAALRGGDPRRCVSLLRSARLRTVAAHRLEGDCHLRAGDRQEAVKVYERVCARSETAANDLRDLVSSLGGRCP